MRNIKLQLFILFFVLVFTVGFESDTYMLTVLKTILLVATCYALSARIVEVMKRIRDYDY